MIIIVIIYKMWKIKDVKEIINRSHLIITYQRLKKMVVEVEQSREKSCALPDLHFGVVAIKRGTFDCGRQLSYIFLFCKIKYTYLYIHM